MSIVRGYIEITMGRKAFRDAAAKEMYNVINPIIKKSANKFRISLQQLVKESFKATSTYDSLINGTLKGHFGFYAGTSSKVDAVIDELIGQIFVESHTASKDSHIILTVNMIESDFQKVTSASSAIITTEKGEQLFWLEWLLLRGTELVLSGYSIPNVRIKRKQGTGRSGKATMVVTDDESQIWHVPITFAGTPGKNWVTDTLKESKIVLDTLFRLILTENLR